MQNISRAGSFFYEKKMSEIREMRRFFERTPILRKYIYTVHLAVYALYVISWLQYIGFVCIFKGRSPKAKKKLGFLGVWLKTSIKPTLQSKMLPSKA